VLVKRHRLTSVHELTFLEYRQSRGPQKNFRMEEWPWTAAGKGSWFLPVHHRRGDSHPRSLGRNTGLSILGLLPSNCMIRLQFDSSTGVRVPNLVPDGLHQARQWPQVEGGGPDWRIPHGPQEVSSGGHRLHEAGRWGLTGGGSLDCRHRGDGAGVDNDRLGGSTAETMYELTTTTPGGDPSGPCQAK